MLASAPALAERMRALNDNVLYAPNVADTTAFAAALDDGRVDPAMDALPRPRIVFTGAVVATKLDVDLIGGAGSPARPDWTFALVGPVGIGDPGTDVSRSERRAERPPARPARLRGAARTVLRGADAALIPYAINQLTASIFPMKVYEYLAAGLPVVATPLPGARGRGGGRDRRRPARLRARARRRAGARRRRRAAGALGGRRGPLLGRAPGRDRGRDRGAALTRPS